MWSGSGFRSVFTKILLEASSSSVEFADHYEYELEDLVF
jgi:hypothetical protein